MLNWPHDDVLILTACSSIASSWDAKLDFTKKSNQWWLQMDEPLQHGLRGPPPLHGNWELDVQHQLGQTMISKNSILPNKWASHAWTSWLMTIVAEHCSWSGCMAACFWCVLAHQQSCQNQNIKRKSCQRRHATKADKAAVSTLAADEEKHEKCMH